MRLFSFIPALAALLTAVTVAAGPANPSCDKSEMGCNVSHSDHKRDLLEHPTRAADGLTNAELLRRGLPLNNPVLRRGTPVRRHHPSSAPEPRKIHHRGVIEVHNAANGNLLGYVSKNLLNSAQSGIDPSKDNALIVKFKTDQTGSGTQLDLDAENMSPDYRFFGLIQGRDDADSTLKSGSFQYGYLGGVVNPGTQPGVPPANIGNSYNDSHGITRTAETAVWTFDGPSGALSPQWVNPDGNLATIKYFTQSNGLYFGGDSDAFHSRYPAPVTVVTYKFVSL